MIVETSGWCHLNEKNRHTENIGPIQIPFIPLPTPPSPLLSVLDCECVFYESRGIGTAGYFTSPNFPISYRPNIRCILYTFIGDVNEIVQLKFLKFDVQVGFVRV